MKLGGWQEVKKKKNGFSFFCFDCFLFFFFFLFLIKNIQIYFRQFTRHSVDRVIGSAGASHPHKHGSDVLCMLEYMWNLHSFEQQEPICFTGALTTFEHYCFLSSLWVHCALYMTCSVAFTGTKVQLECIKRNSTFVSIRFNDEMTYCI